MSTAGQEKGSAPMRPWRLRRLEPSAMIVMVLGIVALCQPWNLFLHRYGLTVIIVGLIGFIVATHLGPPARKE